MRLVASAEGAVAGLGVFYRGRRRALCSGACRLAFKREPDRFVPAEEARPGPLPPGPAERRPSPFATRMAPSVGPSVGRKEPD